MEYCHKKHLQWLSRCLSHQDRLLPGIRLFFRSHGHNLLPHEPAPAHDVAKPDQSCHFPSDIIHQINQLPFRPDRQTRYLRLLQEELLQIIFFLLYPFNSLLFPSFLSLHHFGFLYTSISYVEVIPSFYGTLGSYIHPNVRSRKIHPVSVTEASSVVATTMLAVNTPSLCIFFAMI